jgi:hypothetical protein
MRYTREQTRLVNALAVGMICTMKRKDLRVILENSQGGQMFVQGRFCNIESKHVGLGVYRVQLKSAN